MADQMRDERPVVRIERGQRDGQGPPRAQRFQRWLIRLFCLIEAPADAPITLAFGFQVCDEGRGDVEAHQLMA
jgi:hypothetical protein